MAALASELLRDVHRLAAQGAVAWRVRQAGFDQCRRAYGRQIKVSGFCAEGGEEVNGKGRKGRPPTNKNRAPPLVSQLRDKRIAIALTQWKLSEKLGFDRYSLGRWERGEMVPSLLAFEAWANALDFELRLCEIEGKK